jgi:hypothetical protein
MPFADARSSDLVGAEDERERPVEDVTAPEKPVKDAPRSTILKEPTAVDAEVKGGPSATGQDIGKIQ